MKFLMYRKKEKSFARLESTESTFRVSYWDLHKATNGFSLTNAVGAGGYSRVYKGIFDLADVHFGLWYNGILNRKKLLGGGGTAVAVKVFKPQRRGAFDSFITECEALRYIRHRNLVKIITTCSGVDEGDQNFRAIIFEFMEHGSLERLLHSTQQTYHDGLYKPQILNLRTRINIAVDVACALDYLHHQYGNPIIHCDLKPSNILLDREMVAHVADFGLAKFLPELPNSGRSSSVGLRGTIGYAAPEYLLGSIVSTKGDVYSYGILLLEMLTGKKPTDCIFHGGLTLHNLVWMALPNGVMDIIDPVILQEFVEYDPAQMTKIKLCLIILFEIGVKCSRAPPHVRPDMRDALRQLEKVRSMFNEIQLESVSKIFKEIQLRSISRFTD